MKLILQIPCYNEAEQLPETLAALPRTVPGFDTVEILVIDDGSTDGTAEVAREAGVDHVVVLPHNEGLARAFSIGLEAGLMRGADVILNLDADNQYSAASIPALVAPIVAGEAQIVVGARPIGKIETFSPVKRTLQQLGSWVVRLLSGTDIPDAPSGFRAMTAEAATRLYVFSSYSYTLETIIQAGRLGIPMTWVPVEVNPPTRPSRLMKSMLGYILRSAVTIVRIFVLYNPLRFFTGLAAIAATPGIIVFVRFLLLYLDGEGQGHVQSLVIGGALLAVAAVTFVGGLIADLVAANRIVLTEIRARLLRDRVAEARRREAA
ncbi:MAG: glycosyltransferase family 2 protein [Pseudomonadota bacterium]